MKGCLTVIAVLLWLIAGGGLYLWTHRDDLKTGLIEMMDVPEYGRREYIEERHGEFLRSVDAAAGEAFSVMTFGAAVEKMHPPAEVLYVGINKDDEEIDVIKRFDWNRRSKVTIDRYGAGVLGNGEASRKIMIYENDGPWDYMDSFVIYLEHEGERMQPASQ